jgi:hypothetical protein
MRDHSSTTSTKADSFRRVEIIAGIGGSEPWDSRNRGENHAPKVDQWHDSGSPTGLRRLSPPGSRLAAGSFGRPRAPVVRKLTDKIPILIRILRKLTPSGECRVNGICGDHSQRARPALA